MGGEGEQGLREGRVIAFGHEHPGGIVVHRFGDATVAGGEDGQPAGHGFEHGVGDAFLVAVGAELAGMEEEMRGGVKGAELFLREKAGEDDAPGDGEFGGESLKFGEHGAFACDGEGGAGKRAAEFREGAQAGGEALFGDEAAGLHAVPGAIGGSGAG